MIRTGVLLTAFGGPGDLDEIAPFMTSLLGGEPPAAAVDQARRRYLAIGGASPLPAMAERVAVQVERALNGVPKADEPADAPGFPGRPALLSRARGEMKVPVAVGMLHSEPSISAAVARLAEAGVGRIVSLSLSPFDAAATTGAYDAAVRAAAAEHGLKVVDAAAYRTSDAYLEGLTEAVELAMNDEETRDLSSVVVFTAHSLPVTDVEADPSYVDQLRQTAAAVAQRCGLGAADGIDALPGIEAFGGHGGARPWLLAFQSKGRRAGAWIGPDLDEVIDAAVSAGFAAVVVSPIGFAIDHMETLYDLDVCAADRALSAGIEFARAAAPNDAAHMIDALAEAVTKVL